MAAKVISCPKCHTTLDATKAEPGVKVRCRKCGSIFTVQAGPAQDPLVGKTLGGYEILEKLGEGGIGAVYKARQISLSRLVAFKTLKPEFANNASFVARLQREARLAAQISHPNIVQTIDVGSDKGVHFIAMELVEGLTLTDLISKKGHLDVPEAAAFLEQAARALERAHSLKMIHRDIKPDNMIVTKDGTVKLMDFGLAKRPEVDVSVTQEGAIAGTPRYMSPEQGSGKPLDGRSDIYSLGATLYHALAGAPPFDGPTAVAVILKHVSEALPPIRTCNPLVTPKLAAIIERMLCKKPEDRFQSAQDLSDAITDARATLTTDMAEARDAMAAAPTVMAPPPGVGTDSPAAESAAPTTAESEGASASPEAPAQPVARKGRRIVVWIVLLAVALGALATVQVKHKRDAQRVSELNKQLKELEDRSRELTYDNRYSEAMAVLDKFPAQNAPEQMRQRVEEAKQALQEEAEGRFKKVAEEAEALVKDQKYNEARERYQEVGIKYGVPSIIERAEARAREIGVMMESKAAEMLEELKESGKSGRPGGGVRTKYNDLTRLYPGTAAAREADVYMEGMSKKMRGRQWKDVLTVSKDGKANYTTIRDAVDNALNGSTIEIEDSAVYEEKAIVTSRVDITLKGKKTPPPTIVAGKDVRRPFLPLAPAKMGRYPFADDPGVPAMFCVQTGWRFENLVLVGEDRPKGILVNGSLTVESCVFAKMGGSAISVSARGALGGPMAPAVRQVEVRNCVFLDQNRGAIVTIDQFGGQQTHLDFGNNLLYRVRHAFWRTSGLGAESSFKVQSCIFSNVDLLLHDASPGGAKAWKFEQNCYAPPGPMVYFNEPGAEPITDFKTWQESRDADAASTVEAPMFTDEEAGNFTLKPGSPCAKAGIGPKNQAVLLVKLPAPSPEAAPAAKPGSSAAPAATTTAPPPEEKPKDTVGLAEIQKQRDAVKALLARNQYAEALAACQAMKEDSPWKKERIGRIKRMLDLKKLIIERVNALANVPVPSSLWQRKPDLSGGIFKSATEERVAGEAKGQAFQEKWDELSAEDLRLLAEKCTDIRSASEQMLIGIFCIEQGQSFSPIGRQAGQPKDRLPGLPIGEKDPKDRLPGLPMGEKDLMAKAGQYLNYAKSTAKTPAEKEEATQLLAEVERAIPSPPPKPVAKPSEKPAEKPPVAPPPPPKPQPGHAPSKTEGPGQEVIRKLKDLADVKDFEKIGALFKELRVEHSNDADFLISFGIILGRAVTNDNALKGPLPKRYMPAEMAKMALRRGLQLAPKHPNADHARLYLDKLEELTGEGKPGRRP